jgi:mannitol/fructose-specific phosphotransferase system IIA component (Ntr-type)
MQLVEILKPDCIKVPLASTDKLGAIGELVDLLCEHGCAGDPQALKAAVAQRESTRTTGIGHGLAIPHGRAPGIQGLHMAIGRAAQPIDYQAIDGRPVSLIFLLAGPTDQTGPHIQALAKISRLMISADFRAQIMQASDARRVYDLLISKEQQLTGATT